MIKNKRRITGRDLKGNFVRFKPSKQLKPTSRSKLIEVLFNWVGDDLTGLNCLDCFSETGSFGIEALSRGANHVHFIGDNKNSCDSIAENIKKFGLQDRATILKVDTLFTFPHICESDNLDDPFKSRVFDLLILDPPCRDKKTYLARKLLNSEDEYSNLIFKNREFADWLTEHCNNRSYIYIQQSSHAETETFIPGTDEYDGMYGFSILKSKTIGESVGNLFIPARSLIARKKPKIASRGSKLAIKQVEESIKVFSSSSYCCDVDVAPQLDDDSYQILKVTTQGNKLSPKGKANFDQLNFVSDIEKRLLQKKADFAIHSAIDFPLVVNDELNFFVIYQGMGLPKNDILIFRNDVHPKFNKHMKLGASTLRRKMQAKYHLGALNIHDLNGNIDTRLKKLENGDYDCIILAEADVRRLFNQTHYSFDKPSYGYGFKGYEALKINFKELDLIPCVGQGELIVQFDPNNEYAKSIWASIGREQEYCSNLYIERRFLSKIGADCNSAIAIKAFDGRVGMHDVSVKGEVYGLNRFITFYGTGEDPDTALKMALGDMKEQGGMELLNEHN